MDPIAIAGIVAVVLVLALGGWYLWQRRRSEELRTHYGPEYDHTVSALGDRRRAEAELLRRQTRVEHLEIRALSPQQQGEYMRQWRIVQSKFVDDPRSAVTDADRLVEE